MKKLNEITYQDSMYRGYGNDCNHNKCNNWYQINQFEIKKLREEARKKGKLLK